MDPEPLGRGTYGEVFSATHRATGTRRAVKSVAKAGLSRYVPDVRAFVRREVDILRRLDHPNIVRLYDTWEDEAHVHLVLEICTGGDLLERVAVARERLSDRDAASLMAQMLGAVQHLHFLGIVHRDLKPENFLFSRREANESLSDAPLKLIDFGLSRRLGASEEAKGGLLPMPVSTAARLTPKIGTTEYMAPEAFRGKTKVSQADRVDIWSLGVVLHVIFIGYFPAPRLMEVTPEEYLSSSCWSRVSAEGLNLLAQLLQRDPAKRPSVAVALQHPWLTSVASPGQLPPMLLRAVPAAVHAFADAPALRRMALAVAARESDDGDLTRVRRLFQVLSCQCGGALTRPALEQAAWKQGSTSSVARALASCFDGLDLDGSGSVDWTELAAALLGASPRAVGDCGGASSDPADDLGGGMPILRNDACWRAFDLLSQGSGAVSGASLASLLTHAPEPAGATSAGTGGSGSGLPAGPRLAELQRLVLEVEPSGSVDVDGFRRLLMEHRPASVDEDGDDGDGGEGDTETDGDE